MFNKVVRGDTVAWYTNDASKYAAKVFTDRKGKNVSIYLSNGKILHYEKGDSGWFEISHRLTLYMNRTSSTIFYDYVHDGEKRTFTAKPGFLFSKVILITTFSEDITFWDAKTDIECSSKVVVYGVESTIKNVNVFLNDNRVIHSHKVGNDWIKTTPFVLDIKTNKDNDQFDYRSTRGFGHFNPKANLTVKKIVKKELEIWEAKPEDQGLKVVLMGAKKEEKHISVLLQSGNYVLLQKTGKGECWQDITKSKHNFHKVKMFALDEATSKHRELTTDDYEPIVYESRYGYEVNEGVKCVFITNGGNLMWSHTADPEFGYPKGLYLDLRQNTFSVKNLKGQSKDVTITTIRPQIAVVTPVSGPVETPVAKAVVVAPEVTPAVAPVTKVTAPVVKAPVAGPKGIALSVPLDISSYNLLNPTGVKSPDIVKLYSSKPGAPTCNVEKELDDFDYDLRDFQCEFITHNGNCVWRRDDRQDYPRYMSYNEEDSKIVVSLEDEYYICTKGDNEWKSVVRSHDGFGGRTGPSYGFGKTTPSTPVTGPAVTAEHTELIPVTLDIDKTQSTDEYDYTDENGVVTYTGKAGHVFSKVSEDEYDIWNAVDEVYGTLVRTKTTKGVNFLVILLTNDTFKLFQEREEDWLDVTEDRHDVTKLKFFSEGDRLLKRTDYDINIIDMSFSHTFKTGVKCKKVMLGNEVVWEAGDDPKFPWISVFSLGVASNSFFIKNPSGDVKKIEPKPEVEEVTKEVTEPVTAAVVTTAAERPDFVDSSYTLLKPTGVATPNFVCLYSSKPGVTKCTVEKFFEDCDTNYKKFDN